MIFDFGGRFFEVYFSFFFGCRNVEAFSKSFEYMALVTGVSPSVVLYAMAAGVGGAVRSTRAFYSFTKHHA